MRELEEIKPVGSFILEQKDITSVMSNNGAYFHYSDVCTLLKRILKDKEWNKALVKDIISGSDFNISGGDFNISGGDFNLSE